MSKPGNMGKVKKSSASSSEATSSSSEQNLTLSERIERVFHALQRHWKYLIPFLAALFAVTLYKGSNNAIRNLINAKDETLKDVIFGEQPYLFYCDRNVPNGNSAAGGALEGLPGLFTHMNTIKGGEMGFAVLNCSQTLPSGKTLIERFGLKNQVKPLIWGNSPWLLKPLQLMPKHMKDVSTMHKYVDELLLTPRSVPIKSDKQFHKVCEFSKSTTDDDRDITPTCIVMIKGEKYAQHSKMSSELERRLVLEFPKTRFVMIDGKSQRLSYEDVEEMPYDQFAVKVHAIRNGTHFLSMVNPITWDYLNTFVSHAVSSPLYGYDQHQEDDLIRVLKPAVIAKKQAKKKIMEEKKKKSANKKKTHDETDHQSTKSRNSREDKPTAAKREENTDEIEVPDNKDTVIDPEELRIEQLQRENRRREEMESQAKAHVFETTVEDDESDNDEDDDGDEQVIEL